jgi:3-oxoacyl-[acyl-carrier-protein] synthase-1
MLGAAGAGDAAVCWLALERMSAAGMSIPPNVWDGVRDPELPELRLAARGDSVVRRDRMHVMTNSFGFGGSNCTLIMSRTDT